MEKADLAVIIGRFSPTHLSHQHLFNEALKSARHLLILIGSANSARTIKNPFTYEERRQMIMSSIAETDHDRVFVEPIRDMHYSDDLWVAQVQEKVAHCLGKFPTSAEPEIILVGNYSDSSSYYLQYFPQWRIHPVQGVNNVHATQIRKSLFSHDLSIQYVLKYLPKEIHQFIKDFRKTDICGTLERELNHINQYKEMWNAAPFPVTFNTVDALVTCMGHVLVVKRKTEPGKGLYAMPGGFLRQDEFIQDGALRELKEETGIRVDKPILRQCIVNQRVFDFPNRSLRGRTITHAFHIKLNHKTLPEVKGSDDAEKAFWMPFAEVFRKEELFFEDHAQMIQAFITVG